MKDLVEFEENYYYDRKESKETIGKLITEKDVDIEFEKFLNRIKKNYDFKENDLEEIKKAYEFAKKAHEGQYRKSGDLYISHPLEVAKIVSTLGLDKESIIAALLHDVIEDTKYTLNDIRKEFGSNIEYLVNGLTKISTFGKAQSTRNEEDKIKTLRKMLLASAKDIRILLLKIADRLHNMRTLKFHNKEKQIKIASETLLIYVPIVQKIGLFSIKWELEDLAFKYTNPEMYEYIKKKVNMKRVEREKIVKKVVEEIKTFLHKKGFDDVIVIGRPKNFYSIYKKIKDKIKTFEDIYDLYAVRIITKTIAECYTILGYIHENFQSFPNRLKDYIANPKSNGYQSIHTVIFSRSINFPVELQIKTEEMHKLAEFGVAAHWRYKNLVEDKKFEKKISWLREVLEWEKEHKDNTEFLKLLRYNFFEDEIFVFTPKNEIIVLPEGSSALDFAYAIHTEVGSHAYAVKINGVYSTIDKTLQSGDIIEIITKKDVKPSEKWLQFVKTSKARTKIKDFLNIKQKKSINRKEAVNEENFNKLKEKIERINEFKKVRKAKCCTINYGDQITGVINKDNELVIHNAKCENAKYTLNKKIPLYWKNSNNQKVTIEMILKDRYGILIDILNIISIYNLSVSKLNTKIRKDGSVKLDFIIIDGPYMNELVNKLKRIEGVISLKSIKK